MKISAAFPSKYLKAADLQDRNVSVVIERVELEEVGDTERKPVLHFQARTKGLVLNKTNSRVIAAQYGDDTDSWTGRSLVLFPAMVDFRGDSVEAIRIKVPPARQASPKPPVRQEAENPAADLDDEIPF
jgi:hypothetical protein